MVLLTPSEKFLMTLKFENKPPETMRTYSKCLRKYEAFLAKKKLKNNGDALLEFLDFMVSKEKLKPSTVRLYMVILKRYFNFLEIPFPKVKSPNVPLGKPKFIEKTDIKKLYNATEDNPRLRAEFSLAYSCAVRIEELVTRKRKDVDLANSRVYVAGKTGPQSDAWLPMTRTAVKDSVDYLAWREEQGWPRLQDDDFFFHRDKDTNTPASKSTLTVQLYDLCKQAGVKRISWHIIRHSRATHLRQDKVPIPEIKSLLRHSSINTTLRYASTDTEKLRSSLSGKGELGDDSI